MAPVERADCAEGQWLARTIATRPVRFRALLGRLYALDAADCFNRHIGGNGIAGRRVGYRCFAIAAAARLGERYREVENLSAQLQSLRDELRRYTTAKVAVAA